jgi:hypothetical protein
MTAQLAILLIILAAFGWLLWKGSKPLRATAAFLLIYGLLRVVEIRFFGNEFNNFVRDAFLNIASAFGNLANPNFSALAPLIITIIILGLLAWVMVGGPKGLRAVAGFAIIYIVVRIFDAVALGNGFSDFVSAIAAGLSEAFGAGAANIP